MSMSDSELLPVADRMFASLNIDAVIRPSCWDFHSALSCPLVDCCITSTSAADSGCSCTSTLAAVHAVEHYDSMAGGTDILVPCAKSDFCSFTCMQSS